MFVKKSRFLKLILTALTWVDLKTVVAPIKRAAVMKDLTRLFLHSGYFYSASSSPLLLRGDPDYDIDTVSELTRRRATGNYE